ncbi:hypothetical protein GH714_032638 [Hevea brasiliensis]|uniref:Uncharacterized protein n=1 Tax=Hevea brasiliensis TaxID=3981 RepID=A0A6A6M5F1_HEVBR|nr:hypothetical protein GH714_032638 [Hevea brasiliensis]
MVSVSIGKAITTLLGARSRKLHDAISRLSPDSNKRPSLGSLEDSLWFLHKFVKDGAERDQKLDDILIPIIQHSLRSKDSKHGGQALILINWLFQDEFLFQAVARSLADILARKDDRYIALGWCILIRSLVEYENFMDKHPVNGCVASCSPECICHVEIQYPDSFLPPFLLSSLIIVLCSTLQDGFELPSRLSMSAADCILSISEALTKKNKWSRKSRPLHAKGVEQVLKWLQEIKGHYGYFQDETDANFPKTGALLLSSCWKHYSILLHLEDHKFSQHCNELLDQYISGIQYYSDNHPEGQTENKDAGMETRKFFLNCLCLLLGRLDRKKFESTMSEYGMQISRILLSQLHYADEDVIAGAVCIFKEAIFKPNYYSGDGLTESRQMDMVLPLLLNLLDERDGIAKAVVVLIAEYCSMYSSIIFTFVTGSMNRRNAIDVVSQVLCMSLDSTGKLSHLAWQDIANNLLERFSDEDITIRQQASKLISMIDPALVFPALVHLIYSSDEGVQSCASTSLTTMLKCHSQKPEVICMLLDCLSNLNQGVDLSPTTGYQREGPKVDIDRVLKLMSEWSKSVQNWNSLIGPLIDKMFAEPANATIVRFLSCISEYLAEAADVVLSRVLSQIKPQEGISKGFLSRWESKSCTSEEFMKMEQSLFERLCPLLIIRMLPLGVFDDLNSHTMYGQLPIQGITHDINVVDECVAAFLLQRAFNKYEFEDVRKLAAELCGRIHPQVLLTIVSSLLEHAAISHDILRIKACLFAICSSLMVRGSDSVSHPAILQIRKTIETVVLWPSLDGDEVSKAQHGCIDCLALMICAELQALKSFKDSSEKYSTIGKTRNSGNDASDNSALAYVIHQLTNDKKEVSISTIRSEKNEFDAPVPHSFRLCMANTLISACQKISDSGKKSFARRTLPNLIHSVEMIMHAEIRAACVQVLFSAVYHLKSAILPYSVDLLKLSVKVLREGSEKEKMAGAKLVASLMGSEDAILESISEGLLEARQVLLSISSSDPSHDLRVVCKKLLACITSPSVPTKYLA